MSTKRIKTTNPNWSELNPDLLDLILNKLSLVNKLFFRDVCTSWRSIAKTQISKLNNPFAQYPMLILPDYQNYGYKGFDMSCNKEHKSKSKSCSLVKFEKNKLQKVKNMPNFFGQKKCVGSSHGWLVFFDEYETRYFIYNPFYDIRISLGSLPELLLVSKFIVWSDPIISSNKYAVVAIYGVFSCIAYAMCGDDNWRYLGGNGYSDVICSNNVICAVDGKGSIHSWYFSHDVPTKIMFLRPSFDQETIGIMDTYRDLHTSKFYLIESQGEIFLVIRYIGEYVRIDDGEVVDELDALDQAANGYCTYMTKAFYIYKLDCEGNKWVKIDSLGNKAIVLGGNSSLSVLAKGNECYEENSIYFSDDYWEQMDEHYEYGGHDMGVLNLKDGSIKSIYGVDSINIQPPPFWVVPRRKYDIQL